MLERYFRITERGSTVTREVRGGLVTFVTMAYIVVLNPLIIGGFAAEGPGAKTDAGQPADMGGGRRVRLVVG